jgi:hypothetical protein
MNNPVTRTLHLPETSHYHLLAKSKCFHFFAGSLLMETYFSWFYKQQAMSRHLPKNLYN